MDRHWRNIYWRDYDSQKILRVSVGPPRIYTKSDSPEARERVRQANEQAFAEWLDKEQREGLEHALKCLDTWGEVEPLLLQVEQGNPYVMRNQRARDIVGRALQGKGIKGGRGRRATRTDAKQAAKIRNAIRHLNASCGLPIYDKEESGRTACEIVAQHIGLSGKHVYENIWSKREKQPEAAPPARLTEDNQHPMLREMRLSYEGFAELMRQQTGANPDQPLYPDRSYLDFDTANPPPTPDEVVVYFLTGKFRESERQRAEYEDWKLFLGHFAKKVMDNLKRKPPTRYGKFPI